MSMESRTHKGDHVPIVNEYDALTGENVEKTVSDKDLDAVRAALAQSPSFGELIEAQLATREAALAKLASVGLSAEEIAAL